MTRVFTGFGFGPIQSGLFVREVARSGRYRRIIIAETNPLLVNAIRRNKGSYLLNIAEKDRIHQEVIEKVEIYNPSIPADREKLVESVSVSTEMATCLPSVSSYKSGGVSAVSSILEEGFKAPAISGTLVYAAENDIHAAEILRSSIQGKRNKELLNIQFLNTVIGKMSRLVSDPEEIEQMGLAPIAPGLPRSFLVESFNSIQVTRSDLKEFAPGISSFIEKDNLVPFEEAKLFGHNAIHALLAFLGKFKGYLRMAAVCKNREVMGIARDAFIDESGAALCRKYASSKEPLFTNEGFSSYALDLLERMGNAYLGDTVERAGRDIVRKLGPDDRLFGTIKLASEHGIEAPNLAIGAMAAIAALIEPANQNHLPGHLEVKAFAHVDIDYIEKLLEWLWRGSGEVPSTKLLNQLMKAKEQLLKL